MNSITFGPTRAGNGERRGALEIQVWSDFVCPYCFLAEGPLKQAMDGLDVRLEWMPFELRPFPEATLRPEGDYLQSVWKASVYPLASRLGVDIRLPDVSPQPYSRLAHEGLLFARAHCKADPYVDAVFRAFFQRGLDIGDPAVLERTAGEVGLQRRDFAQALATGRHSAAHQELQRLARSLAIHAVPTIIVGDQRISGMPGPGALRKLLLRCGARPTGERASAGR